MATTVAEQLVEVLVQAAAHHRRAGRGFALAGMRTVLAGGVGKMIGLARSNLRSVPRHPLR